MAGDLRGLHWELVIVSDFLVYLKIARSENDDVALYAARNQGLRIRLDDHLGVAVWRAAVIATASVAAGRKQHKAQ